MITPQTDKLLIAIEDDEYKASDSGIYSPTKGLSRELMKKQGKYKIDLDNYDLHRRIGKVEAIGPKVRDVHVGDTILINIHNGETFKHEGQKYCILEEKYAVAIIENV